VNGSPVPGKPGGEAYPSETETSPLRPPKKKASVQLLVRDGFMSSPGQRRLTSLPSKQKRVGTGVKNHHCGPWKGVAHSSGGRDSESFTSLATATLCVWWPTAAPRGRRSPFAVQNRPDRGAMGTRNTFRIEDTSFVFSQLQEDACKPPPIVHAVPS